MTQSFKGVTRQSAKMLLVLSMLFSLPVDSHLQQERETSANHPTSNEPKNQSTAHYLANAGVMISSGSQKVLFDPLYDKDFGYYHLVPDPMRQAMEQGKSPYDGVQAIIISHAHDDHFSAGALFNYLRRHPKVALIAPQQAIDKLQKELNLANLENPLYPVDLDFHAQPASLSAAGLEIDAVRIPHAGWPGRAEVQNLVFRVTFETGKTVMHMGDADPQIEHYLVFKPHWQRKSSHLALPPYWFFHSYEGRDILDHHLNVVKQVGVHVPKSIPALLKNSQRDYFGQPGESRKF